MVIVGSLLTFVRSFSNFYFCTKAGRKLHSVLIAGVLNASMVFFDDHLVGNILNRVSKDFHTIDEVIPYVVYENFRVSLQLGTVVFLLELIFQLFFQVAASVVLILSVNYYFAGPLLVLFIFLYYIRRYYIPTGRSLKRLEAAGE